MVRKGDTLVLGKLDKGVLVHITHLLVDLGDTGHKDIQFPVLTDAALD